MKKTLLDKKHKKAIKEWLVNLDSDRCPFWDIIMDCPGQYKVCSKLFPKINAGAVCPCHAYSLEEVIKKAKAISVKKG